MPDRAWAREALRDALPASVDALGRARVADLPDGLVDDCLALRWLEWPAGRLRNAGGLRRLPQPGGPVRVAGPAPPAVAAIGAEAAPGRVPTPPWGPSASTLPPVA